ncbi:hypothetical protein [Halomontanus rarus]|uniref:hypothetical protein n=1 Tax=Halomontanus rarus TaxID=3034020 RepID=UPI001A99624F
MPTEETTVELESNREGAGGGDERWSLFVAGDYALSRDEFVVDRSCEAAPGTQREIAQSASI